MVFGQCLTALQVQRDEFSQFSRKWFSTQIGALLSLITGLKRTHYEKSKYRLIDQRNIKTNI